MRLNRRGDWAMGQGGLQGSVNGTHVPDGMGPHWFNDDLVVYPCLSRPAILAWDRVTAPFEVSGRGANDLAAGGSVWATWLAGFGLQMSTGIHLPDAGLLAVGPTGEVAYVPNRQHGTGAHVQELGGGVWLLTDGIVYDLQLLGHFRAIWTFEQRVFVHGLPQPSILPGGVWRPRVVERTPGEFWVCYFSGQFGVILHPLTDSSSGYTIAAPGVEAFYHEACILPDGRIKIAWSAGQGEIPTDYRDRIVDVVNEPRQSFEVPVDPIVAIGKPCWLAWFEFTNSLAMLPPGNALLMVKAGGHILRASNGEHFAQWVQGATVEEIEQQAAAATLPVVAYWDARAWPKWPTLPANAWLSLQAYCLVSETPQTFEANMRAVIDSVPAQYTHVALVCQCYTSNTGHTQNLAGLVPVFARLARDYPRITMLLPFSDQGRATGLNDHPDVRDEWQQLFDGITGEPQQGGNVSAPNEFAVVQQVAAEYPQLLQTNTIVSCTEFTQRVLERLNGEWGHVGKTAGEGQGKPEGFEPRSVRGVDGNMHLITGVSYDVLFHAPTYRQVDMLGNATANEPGPWPKGPASPVWNEIAPEHYRANNPWIEKVPVTSSPEHPPIDGDVGIAIHAYPRTVKRSELAGLVLVYETNAVDALLRFGLNDGAPPIVLQVLPNHPPPFVPGDKDLRYQRATGWKPDRNGDYIPFAEVLDPQTRAVLARVEGDHIVTVTE